MTPWLMRCDKAKLTRHFDFSAEQHNTVVCSPSRIKYRRCKKKLYFQQQTKRIHTNAGIIHNSLLLFRNQPWIFVFVHLIKSFCGHCCCCCCHTQCILSIRGKSKKSSSALYASHDIDVGHFLVAWSLRQMSRTACSKCKHYSPLALPLCMFNVYLYKYTFRSAFVFLCVYVGPPQELMRGSIVAVKRKWQDWAASAACKLTDSVINT